jgi:MFS family permease
MLSTSQIFKSKVFLCFLFSIRALSIIVLLINNHPVLFLLFVILFGLVYYGTFAPTQLIASEYFKNYSMGYVFGLLALFHQTGSALGAYLPGLLYDLTGNYYGAFLAGVGFLLVAAGVSLMNSFSQYQTTMVKPLMKEFVFDG